MEFLKELFAAQALSMDESDGISMTFENWRFNIRKSKTETSCASILKQRVI